MSHGAIVGERYRIVAPLARGGFGAVYVAEQLTTERRVALKVLARYAEHISVDRLLAEARVTSRILSDHIVQVIDAGVDLATSDVFVVMELLRGTTLDDHLMQHGALPPEDVAEYMRQIAVGLDKTHGHLDRNGRPTPVIHRDLKPSNLFLTARDDGQPLLKILDFGAAKVLSLTTKASGMIRGTPQFMASEQALGDPCTPATDIWAFGLIAFNLLTGSSYWLTVQRDDGTEAQLFAEILTLPLVSARQRVLALGLNLELPPAFDGWFSRCVNRDPTQRFASAGLAAAELSRVLGAEPARGSEPAHRPPPAVPVATAAVNPRRAGVQQLDIQSVAAVSRTPQLSRPGRLRTSLATFGIVLAGSAGAAAVVLWKRAPAAAPSLGSISASPPPSSSGGAAPARNAAPPTVPPSAALAPSAVPAPSAQASAQPLLKASPGTRSPTGAKRAPSSARPVAPPKTSAASRDPYEQR